MSSQRQDRIGGAARRPGPNHQEVVVVINHLNRVGKPCRQLRPTATDPALHLRGELGDELRQLGLRCHRSHSIGTAQPRHRNGCKPRTSNNDTELINVNRRADSLPLKGSAYPISVRTARQACCDGDHRREARAGQVEVLAASWVSDLVAVERGNVRLKSDPTT